jgi:hypothetical protein
LGADRPTPGRSTGQAHIDRLGAVLNGLRFTTAPLENAGTSG